MSAHETAEVNLSHEEIKYNYFIQRGLDFTKIELFRSAREHYKQALLYKPGDPFVSIVSGYDDAVSEITQIASINLRPTDAARTELTLRTGHGSKADKTLDEWLVKEIKSRKVNLSEEFLAKRGWKFEALVPLWLCAGAK